MRKKWLIVLLLSLVMNCFSGCNLRTISEMYCLPKRSEEFANLQSVIDRVMVGLEYSAPVSGDNRQTVQMADLNGDGTDEYILFAKGASEHPLQIFIFTLQDAAFVLLDTIVCNGTAFEQVEYIQMDENNGAELVVGTLVSEQVVRSVSVFTLSGGQIEQLMNVNYSKFVCCDLDNDSLGELLVLRPGVSEGDNGIAELYGLEKGSMERSTEVSMSEPSDRIKRIMISRLNDGRPAVYVASDVDNRAIITDVYAIVNDVFTNVSFSNESGTSVQTLRNYYVYADDIDNNGILELPNLITMKLPDDSLSSENQYLIRWYAMTSHGKEIDKQFTYHNYIGGWYMDLDSRIAHRYFVTQKGSSYEFSLWNEDFDQYEKIMTVYVLTGQKREEQAVIDNRFVIYRNELTIYAGNLEVASAAYGMTQEKMINSFHLILQDWKTGET